MIKLKMLRGLRHVLDIVTVMAMIVMVVLFAQTAGVWPAPEMTKAAGENVLWRYGVRMLLLALFFAGSGLIGLLFLFSRFQRLYRYPVEITAKNIEIQYMLAKIMLSLNQLVCAVYVCALMVGIYRASVVIPSAAFYILTAAAAAVCVAVTGLYVFYARKSK